MENENKAGELFQSFKEGLGEFGSKVNKMVDDLFAGDFGDGELKVRSDVYEAGDFLVLEIELPGVKKEEVNLQVHNGILSIKGIKPRTGDPEQDVYLTRERRFGGFIRNFVLPDEVEVDKIKAKYESGVLSIRLPIVREEEEEDDSPEIIID